MNLGQLASRAKELVQKRGGTDAVKADAEELRGIASQPGSMSDKAKAAAEALKEPGTDEATPGATPRPETAETQTPGAAGPDAAAPPGGGRRARRGGGRRGRRRGR